MRRFYLMDRSGAGALAHLALWRRGAEITVRYLAPRRDAKLRFPPVPESAVPVECSVYAVLAFAKERLIFMYPNL